MIQLKQLFKYYSQSSSPKGYSLTELLIAAGLTTIIIGGAGFGIQMSLQADQKALANSAILSRINSTMTFMSDEIRSATKVEIDAAYAVTNQAPSFKLPSGGKPVLAIQRPGVNERIIYYVVQPTDSRLAPKVLYRWGPSFNENGQYKTDQVNNPSLWTYAPLTDLLSSQIISEPSCPSTDWQPNPPTNADGFYTCVNTKNLGLVQLNINSTIERPTGKPISKTIKTIVFARATQQQGGGTTIPKFKIINRALTLDEPANITFQVLGGAITCGAGGANIPVTTKLYLNNKSTAESWNTSQPLTMSSQPQGTTVNVESTAELASCNHKMTVNTKDTNSQQITVLMDGDPVPSITPFANQATIDVFLRNYIQNGKIKLAPNQVIYLFELGTTSITSTAFDLQDNVVLATIDAPK